MISQGHWVPLPKAKLSFTYSGQRPFNPIVSPLVEESEQMWCDGSRGSKAGRERRPRSPEMAPCPALPFTGSCPSLGLSFLQVKPRRGTQCPCISLAPPGGGSGSYLRFVLFSEKQMRYFSCFFLACVSSTPFSKCFPVLIYLAKEVCGERYQTGNGCHSCCLHFCFLRLSSAVTFPTSGY